MNPSKGKTMNKIEFKLKQHTPIIHFLHEQPGATLRATELKPKLDKFLIKHAFNDNFDEYKTHLVGWKEGKQKTDFIEKKAFDYKLKIFSDQTIVFDIEKEYQNEKGKIKEKQFPLFFGNLGNDENEKTKDKKKFVISPIPIIVKVFSFDQSLLNSIKNCIPQFFLETNFGARQSKGFGSFYLDKNDPNYIPPFSLLRFSIDVHAAYGKEIRNNDSVLYEDFETIFLLIDLLYKSLRSGLNDIGRNGPRFYFKPMMFRLALKNEIQWDKRTIKKYYFRKELKDQKIDHKNPDILTYSSDDALMKEVLGLSTSEKWESKYNTKITKENINYKNDKKIERFKSPITFKIIQKNSFGCYDVFILTEPINKEFLGQEFVVKAGGKGDLSMYTPSVFNIDSFLKFAFTEVDLNKHVQKEKYRKRWQFKILESIYNEIKTNLKANHD